MINNIELLAHSAVRIKTNKGKIIYFDPFKLNDDYKNDADIIFISHPHYDHFSPEDILKIKKNTTIIVVTKDLIQNALELEFDEEKIVPVIPNEKYEIEDISFETVPAYNLNKKFHPKDNNWVGYICNIDGKSIYFAGDTDNTEDNRKIKCDIAFVPVGGTYTMTAFEAAELIKEIKPKLAIPMHYKTIIGSVQDAIEFKKILDNIVDVRIIMK